MGRPGYLIPVDRSFTLSLCSTLQQRPILAYIQAITRPLVCKTRKIQLQTYSLRYSKSIKEPLHASSLNLLYPTLPHSDTPSYRDNPPCLLKSAPRTLWDSPVCFSSCLIAKLSLTTTVIPLAYLQAPSPNSSSVACLFTTQTRHLSLSR